MPRPTPANPLPHIVLCTEADARIGLGHVVRCAGLLGAVRTPHRLTVLGGDSALAARHFPGARLLPAPDWTGVDWPAVIGADGSGPDLVLADIPFYRARDWASVRCPGVPLLAIDDHGGAVDADLVVNGTVLPQYHHYLPTGRATRLLVGPQYALLRPEFAATPWTGGGQGLVTLVIGSGPAARDWALALAQWLATHGATACGARALRWVVGGGFDALPQLRALCAAGGMALQQGLDAATLAQWLAGSDAVLLTAGMVLYEAVACGVPTVAYPQIDDLRGEAAWFAARGACIDLGPQRGAPEAAAAALCQLLAEPERAAAMSRAQRDLVDGQGLARAAAVIDSLLSGAPARPAGAHLQDAAT